VADHEARGGTLILGGGFADSYLERSLGKHGATIVSPENYMLRQMCRHSELLLGEATAQDAGRRRVQVLAGFFRRDIAQLGTLGHPGRVEDG